MKLNLERPLVFLDIEATGLSTETDRIVELAMCKIMPDETRILKCYRYNPEMPIPPAATEIHGISDDDVKDKPFFHQHAKAISKFISGCDLAGFNSNRFDIPMLYAELSRSQIFLDYQSINLVDVGNIFKIKEPRTLEAAVQFYCGKPLENAHSAEADILGAVDVLMGQLEKYPDLPQNMQELALFSNYGAKILDLQGKFTYNEKGQIILNFGKYKGEPAADHLDFLEWMVHKANFPRDTVEVAMGILYPEDGEADTDDEEYW